MVFTQFTDFSTRINTKQTLDGTHFSFNNFLEYLRKILSRTQQEHHRLTDLFTTWSHVPKITFIISMDIIIPTKKKKDVCAASHSFGGESRYVYSVWNGIIRRIKKKMFMLKVQKRCMPQCIRWQQLREIQNFITISNDAFVVVWRFI